MDYIPRVRDPAHPVLDVPYFVQEGHEYRGVNDFHDFPSKHRFDISRLKYGDFGNSRKWVDAASFVQAWCYFGMIIEVFKVSFLTVDIRNVSKASGEIIVSNAKLHNLVRVWYHRDRNLNEAEKKKRAGRVYNILATVSKFVSGVIFEELRGSSRFSSEHVSGDEETPWQASDIIPQSFGSAGHLIRVTSTDQYFMHDRNFFSTEPDSQNGVFGRIGSKGHLLFLSIILTGETLESAAHAIYGKMEMADVSWPRMPLVESLLNLAGWCPRDIRVIRWHCNESRLYYLSFLDRRSLTKDHKACRSHHCAVDHINEDLYETRHVDKICRCSEIRLQNVSGEDASSYIRDGQIPVIMRASGDNNGPNSGWTMISRPLRSGVDNSAISYVAISHVWADGRGNPRENTLPECQLQRLQNVVNDLYDSNLRPVPFWVDTICIPVALPLRKVAIAAMKTIYEEADKVLVLDASLESSSLEASAEECLTRIEYSTWMQRLWTLQEGAFAKNLYFRFIESAVSVEGLQQRYRMEQFSVDIDRFEKLGPRTSPSRSVYAWQPYPINPLKPVTQREYDSMVVHNIYDPTLLAVRTIRHIRRLSFEVPFNSLFLLVVRLLQNRVSSKPVDEALCIATLLNVDTELMTQVPPKDRMMKLLSSLETVPAGLIFGNRPRLQGPFHRWMPSTFLGENNKFLSIEGHVTSDGLRVIFHGFRLGRLKQGQLEKKFLVILDAELPFYEVSLDMDGVMTCDYSDAGNLAVVLENELGNQPRCRALIVQIRKEEKRCIFANYGSSAQVRPYMEEWTSTGQRFYVGWKLSAREWVIG